MVRQIVAFWIGSNLAECLLYALTGGSANIDFECHFLRIGKSMFQSWMKWIDAFRQNMNRTEQVHDVVISANPPEGAFADAKTAEGGATHQKSKQSKKSDDFRKSAFSLRTDLHWALGQLMAFRCDFLKRSISFQRYP